mgnify:CR=1 FL=1
MEIGGFFPYQPVGSEPNNYVEHTCPDPGDTAHLMSGRCAIYYCLRDLMLTDQKRVAYLPSYDCETVLGCFVKAGYENLEDIKKLSDDQILSIKGIGAKKLTEIKNFLTGRKK